ncbi:hypothetical protein GY14_32175 [Delftia tsuruhatensis]|nr:hypothetical protein GY14_32175 [Delftia tsuruhatensis]
MGTRWYHGAATSVPAVKASVGSAVNRAKKVLRMAGKACLRSVALMIALARDVLKPAMTAPMASSTPAPRLKMPARMAGLVHFWATAVVAAAWA